MMKRLTRCVTAPVVLGSSFEAPVGAALCGRPLVRIQTAVQTNQPPKLTRTFRRAQLVLPSPRGTRACSSSAVNELRRNMKRALSITTCVLLLGLATIGLCFAKLPERGDGGSGDAPRPNVVAVNTNDLEAFTYDAGKVRFIAPSEETAGAYAVMELTEMPGYKTAWHQHNTCEESFHVLEGVLTIKLRDKEYTLPAGSYVLIPRGTPHGQGNFGDKPLRLLTTFTPGGFDAFFRERVELYKTVKPGDPSFGKRFDELRARNKRFVQILGTWEPKK
jgi:quercetin dioxygenase-like cupin family protein